MTPAAHHHGMSVQGERTSVLVLRAWLEPGDTPVRVRITERKDLRAAEERSWVVVGAETASSAVRAWLLELERDDEEDQA
jgi:hypothetical protein